MTTVKKAVTNTKKTKARSTAKAKAPTTVKASNTKLVSRHAVLGFSSRRVWPDQNIFFNDRFGRNFYTECINRTFYVAINAQNLSRSLTVG